MRSLAAFALLVVCGCASSGSGVATAASPRTQTVGVGSMGGSGTSTGNLTISPSGGPNVNTLDFPVDKVWRILPAAFDSLAIPVSRIDPAAKVMGNDGFKLRQRLGKVYLSRYVDCGQTQIGQNADEYDMYMTIVIQLVPQGTGTKIVTTFEASARPLTFSQEYSHCTSKGILEARLLSAIQSQLK